MSKYLLIIWIKTPQTEDQISFSSLEINIIRNTDKKAFETSAYRKSAFSDVFTNFKSFVPMTYEIGLFFNVLLLWKLSRGNCQAEKNLSAKFLPRKIYR